jgi:acetyl-CoA acetyltransferase
LGEAVAIAASYELPPRRYTELEFNDLYGEVLKGLFARWGGRPEDIDGLMASPGGGMTGHDTYIHDRLVSETGIRPTFLETLNMGGGTFPCMVDRATMAIRAGRASAVLCIGAGKMLKPRGDAGRLMASAISDLNLEVPYGAFIPALYAMLASEYVHRYQLTAEDMARVAVSARRWANLNPSARTHGDGPLTIQDVVSSRMICSPFRFYDCSFPSDGGGAVIVARGDLARKWSRQPAYVLGFGEYHARGSIGDPGPFFPPGAARSGAEAFAAAGMQPKDIKVAQIYDAFTVTTLILLEALGFCEPGAAPAFVNRGAIDPGGELPVNTYGGLLSFGHAGDSSGMSLITAGAMQVMGEAGPTQVLDADRVLIHAYGGVMYDNATLILGREP